MHPKHDEIVRKIKDRLGDAFELHEKQIIEGTDPPKIGKVTVFRRKQ